MSAGLAAQGLFEMGRLHDGGNTLILIGADRDFWPVFSKSTEYGDGAPDPLDRWSKRIIGDMAAASGASDIYPSDGPPYAPFINWALRTGRFWQSPTGMMVHDIAGLMISIRGALRFNKLLGLPALSVNPCDSCANTPCIPACPVDALSNTHAYDVPTCKKFIVTQTGKSCRMEGCLVRRACPVSAAFGRDPKQSGFHMRAFIGVKK